LICNIKIIIDGSLQLGVVLCDHLIRWSMLNFWLNRYQSTVLHDLKNAEVCNVFGAAKRDLHNKTFDNHWSKEFINVKWRKDERNRVEQRLPIMGAWDPHGCALAHTRGVRLVFESQVYSTFVASFFSRRHFGHLPEIKTFGHFKTLLFDWKRHYDGIDLILFGHLKKLVDEV